MAQTVKLGSLFDGSGGFPLAGIMSGITPVWASEVELYPIRVTTKRLPNMKHYGDISQMDGSILEPVDIITGGSPCQDLSVAGKRAGLDGERSGLFRQQIRIIKEMREATNGKYPRFMVWENVPGALSSNKGEDFKCVLEETARVKVPTFTVPMPDKGKWGNSGLIVDEANNFSIGWRILDAQYWGVPQRRRRIFLVADFDGTSSKEILFKREGLSRDFKTCRDSWQGAAANFKESTDETGRYPESMPIYSIDREAMSAGFEFDRAPGIDENEIAYTLKATGPGAVSYPQLFENHSQDTRYKGPLDVAQTVSATYGMGGNNQPFVVEEQVLNLEMEVMVRKHEVDKDKLCNALKSAKANVGLSNKEIAEALQLPLTLVEHWFRNDESFAIPQPEVWEDLKRLLHMDTREFDAQVTEFECKPSEYDMRNRIYMGNIAPTLTTNSKEDKYLLPYTMQVRCGKEGGGKGALIQVDQSATLSTQNNQTLFCVSRTHGVSVSEDIVQTIQAAAGESGNNQPMVCIPIQDQAISNGKGNGTGIAEQGDPMYTLMAETHHGVAYSLQGNMIGRADENGPQGSGVNEDVNFTLNATDKHGVCYGIDRALDDNESIYRVYCASKNSFFTKAEEELANTLVATDHKDPPIINDTVECDYIVRRLTPLECARLQGFPDWWTYDLGLPNEEIDERIMEIWRNAFEVHREVITKASKPKTDKQIRKWLVNPSSDSAEYKMWGNGVALPCVLYVMEGIADEIKKREGE